MDSEISFWQCSRFTCGLFQANKCMRLKKAHTHIKNYNCNKTPLLHKKMLENRFTFLLWKCFCAARDLYAFSLLLHAMTIYYSIQIAGKLSFYSFKECLYALQHVYLYILGREVPMYTISIQTQQKKNSYVIVISCHDNEVGNFSAFLLFKPNGGLRHGKCAMK